MPAPLPVLLASAKTAASHPGGIQPWQLIVAVSVVITLVVGLGSFVDWGNRIRNRRVDRRILELVTDQLMAEDIEGRVQQLGELNRKLQRQIDGLPAEANRLFLQQRMDVLATSIAQDFEEYRSLEVAIGTSASSTALDPMIRQAIEQNMLSPQKRRDRRNLYVLVLLGLLIALNLLPISVSGLVYQYFGVLGDSPYSPGADVVGLIFIGSLVIALVLLFVAELSTWLLRALDRLQGRRWLIGLAVAIVLVAAAGYWFRYFLLSQACFPIGCYPSPGTYALAGVALNLEPLLVGLSLAVLARRAWLRRSVGERSSLGRRRRSGQTEGAPAVSAPPSEPENAPAND